MRILLSLLLLLGVVNLILARSVYWNADNYNPNSWMRDYDSDYDLFQIPSKGYDDDFHKLWMGEDSDESPEILKSINDLINDLDKSEENNHNNDNVEQHNGNENNDNDNDNETSDEILKSMQDLFGVWDKSEEQTVKNDDMTDSHINANDHDDHHHKNIIIKMFFNNPFVHMENGASKSSEEKQDSDEEQEAIDKQVESFDLTKSSEEKKDVDISEKDIEELAALLITLTAIDDLIEISNKSPEHAEEDDYELKSKEVDEFLSLFSSILDQILEEEQKGSDSQEDKDNDSEVTTPKNDSDEENDNDDDDDTTPETDSDEENDDDVTTPETNSDEDNDNDNNDDDVTTAQNESEEDNNSDEDDNVTTPKNDSEEDNNNDDSNENEIESFSLTFHSIDDHEHNLNDHQYEVVDPSATQAIKPTNSPLTTFSFDDNNIIEEFVELRQNVNTDQNALEVNEQNLDKDFYNIISNNYNEESIKRFEKDFFVVRENLDRIKRNINAMENLSSKIYLHKLVNEAVQNTRK